MQMAKLTENAIEYQIERIKLHTSLLCKKSCSVIFQISEAHHLYSQLLSTREYINILI